MNKVIKKGLIFIAVMLVLIGLVGLYFFENIQGYYRFKEYCEREGGLKIYEKLEKNVGWMADSESRAKTVAQFKYVSFSRYAGQHGEKSRLYDVNYIGGHKGRSSSYSIVDADEKNSIGYKWLVSINNVADELRLGKQKFEVYNAETNKLMVSFTRFSYSLLERKKTLLGSPSGIGCYDLSLLTDAINSSFSEK